MKPQELGSLFEKATAAILREMFQCWGFKIFDTKIQASGSQHGFDIYFKISNNRIPLSLFIECKASEKENEIESFELSKKIFQFEWANFPQKDVHIFFSPTRRIKFANE